MSRLLFAFLISAAALAAQAQSWPSKPVRVIVPYPPGAKQKPGLAYATSGVGSQQHMAAEFDTALADPALQERLGKAALQTVGGSTGAFAALVRGNFEMYRQLVADLKIRVN